MKLEIRNFLKKSSIHGLVYISRQFNIVETIFWTITLTSSIFCTLTLIIELWIKMKSFPIVAYLLDTSVPVSEIYFPAVTICPTFAPFQPARNEIYFFPKQFYRYEKHNSKRYWYEDAEYLEETKDETRLNMSYTEILNKIAAGDLNPKDLGIKILKRLQVIDLIQNLGVFSKVNHSIPTDDFLEVINEFHKEFLVNFRILHFKFHQDLLQYVSEVITPFGLCFTFNMALSHDSMDFNITSEDFNYQLFQTFSMRMFHIEKLPEVPDFPKKETPYPSGLEIGIDKYTEDHPKIEIGGYFLILHDPFELRSSISKTFNLNVNQNSHIKIASQINMIDDSIADYDPIDRNCYLETERTLKFFKKYTKANCIQECLTDFMINQCKCAEFFMIRNSTTQICSANEKNCTENAKNDFEAHQQSCKCLDPCTFFKYDFEFIENSINQATPGYIFVKILIEFCQSINNPLVRKQQFDIVDFFSYFGGLLGLLAGISMLSIVEIIYWFTVRLVEHKLSRLSTKVRPFREDSSRNNRIIAKARVIVTKYFNQSSIHGFKFVNGEHLFERLIWICIILCSFLTCFYMMSETNEKIPDSRIVAFDDNFKHIRDIPFPSITILPDIIVDNYVFQKFENDYKMAYNTNFIPTEDDLRLYELFARCRRKTGILMGKTIYDMRSRSVQGMKQNSRIEWFQKQKFTINERYQPVFAQIMTQSVMAYSFNLLDAEELLNSNVNFTEYQYYKNVTSKLDKNATKIKNLTTKKGSNVVLSLNFKKDNQNKSRTCNSLQHLVHKNDLMPRFIHRNDFNSLMYGTTVDIEVIPEIIQTDPKLKKLKPNERDCYFNGEKTLKLFKKYSQKNCFIECFANYTIKMCGCIDGFWQPVENENYCFKRGVYVRCISEALENEFLTLDIPSINCSCLPTCDSISYHIKYFHKFSMDLDEISINLRVNTEDTILFRRYQQFTFSDVVSCVGGLLGLFAGISMLSIVEIFYFFVIRVAVDVWRALRGQ